jgi:excisionase family DNA binding protein
MEARHEALSGEARRAHGESPAVGRVLPEDAVEARRDRLLTKDEAADVLKVAVRFIDRCVVERRIRYVKVGRHIRIAESALEAYVAASTVEPFCAVPVAPFGERRARRR